MKPIDDLKFADGRTFAERREELSLVWPEKPTCHHIDSVFTYSGTQEWRSALPDGMPAHGRFGDAVLSGQLPGPYGYPFRTCSYCGSIHPEDLYAFLMSTPTVRLGGSDWKYGWPHKFYVEGIPNPLAGKDVIDGGHSGARSREELGPRAVNVRPRECNGVTLYDADMLGKGPEFAHAKWYNEHLKDITDERTFKEMARLIEEHAHVRFEMKDGKLMYSAPYRGYQASAGG